MNKVRAQTIVTANPGCLLQMRLGIIREGAEERMRAVHLADLLLEAVNGQAFPDGSSYRMIRRLVSFFI